MPGRLDHDPGASPVLVCLDLQRDPLGRTESPRQLRALAACVRLLRHARTQNWEVIHVHRRRLGPRAGSAAAPPLPGAEPRACEPVFRRRGLSAFTDPDFARHVGLAADAEVVLAGLALGAAGLATALAAVDRGLRLTLVEDAMAPPFDARDAASSYTVTADQAEAALFALLAPVARVTTAGALLSETSADGLAAAANEH